MSPLYEYWCKSCGHQCEIVQGFDATTVLRCPNCDGAAYRKPSRFSFSFGWRLTEDSHIPNPHPELGRKEDKVEKDV